MVNGEETVPEGRCNNAAMVRGKEAGLEVEVAEEMACRVGERDSGGPGNEFGRVGGPSRGEELDGAEFHNAVERAEREAVPLGPPAASRMTHGFIGGVLE